jgi:hypothetical protein
MTNQIFKQNQHTQQSHSFIPASYWISAAEIAGVDHLRSAGFNIDYDESAAIPKSIAIAHDSIAQFYLKLAIG